MTRLRFNKFHDSSSEIFGKTFFELVLKTSPKSLNRLTWNNLLWTLNAWLSSLCYRIFLVLLVFGFWAKYETIWYWKSLRWVQTSAILAKTDIFRISYELWLRQDSTIYTNNPVWFFCFRWFLTNRHTATTLHDFQKLSKTFKDFWRLPKTLEDFRDQYAHDFSSGYFQLEKKTNPIIQ